MSSDPSDILRIVRSRRCPGLYYVKKIPTFDIESFVEREREKALPVASVTGKVGKDPRFRIDYGAYYGTDGRLGPARAIPEELQYFLDYCDEIVRLTDITNVPEKKPDQCLINIYPAGKTIGAHTDHKEHFGPVIFCVTFGCERTMRFTKDEEVYDIVTPPGSLYIMSGDARKNWKHEMLPTTEECYSITARYLRYGPPEHIPEVVSEKPRKKTTNLASVVNVKVAHMKVAHIGRRFKNLREWMSDPDNVYIGRAGIVFVPTEDGGEERCPKRDSPWANPYKVDKDGTRDEVIEMYEKYIRRKIQNEELDIEELRGKTLGCWCKPDRCHGDVLLNLLEDI